MKSSIINDSLEAINREEFIIKILTKNKYKEATIIEINKSGNLVFTIELTVKYDFLPDDLGGVYSKKIELLQVRDKSFVIQRITKNEIREIEEYLQNKIICDIIHISSAYND